MKNTIKELQEKIAETLCGRILIRTLDGKEYNCPISRPCIKHETQKGVSEYMFALISTTAQAVRESIIKEIEEMNNFRQAKADGKDDWNNALEQSALKVDALIKSLKQ